jgi:hypothetical protein
VNSRTNNFQKPKLNKKPFPLRNNGHIKTEGNRGGT